MVDEDLGVSGSGLSERSGFARLTAEVALGHAGLVLGLEVSRLARNSVDWYRLLDLCGVTDTLIGDADGLYHPGSFNDRLLLGLKGTMSEAELHVLRSRLEGGIRNKAKRGELRRGLPVGLVWGDEDGEVLLHPDEAIRGAIQVIFERFAELGSVRQVWLWMRAERVRFPQQRFPHGEIEWVTPTYHQVLLVRLGEGSFVAVSAVAPRVVGFCCGMAPVERRQVRRRVGYNHRVLLKPAWLSDLCGERPMTAGCVARSTFGLPVRVGAASRYNLRRGRCGVCLA